MRLKANALKPERVNELILDYLIDGALTVQQLAKLMQITTKRVSYSIEQLNSVGKLDYERKGKQIFWEIHSKKKRKKLEYKPNLIKL